MLLTDLCSDQLELARMNMKGMASVNFKQQSILGVEAKEKVDIIYSHGVLEHFPNHCIRDILKRQRKCAGKVVHYVPTNGYKTQSFGDERLMSFEWWVCMWKPIRHILFNNDKDLLLIWEY